MSADDFIGPAFPLSTDSPSNGDGHEGNAAASPCGKGVEGIKASANPMPGSQESGSKEGAWPVESGNPLRSPADEEAVPTSLHQGESDRPWPAALNPAKIPNGVEPRSMEAVDHKPTAGLPADGPGVQHDTSTDRVQADGGTDSPPPPSGDDVAPENANGRPVGYDDCHPILNDGDWESAASEPGQVSPGAAQDVSSALPADGMSIPSPAEPYESEVGQRVRKEIRRTPLTKEQLAFLAERPLIAMGVQGVYLILRPPGASPYIAASARRPELSARTAQKSVPRRQDKTLEWSMLDRIASTTRGLETWCLREMMIVGGSLNREQSVPRPILNWSDFRTVGLGPRRVAVPCRLHRINLTPSDFTMPKFTDTEKAVIKSRKKRFREFFRNVLGMPLDPFWPNCQEEEWWVSRIDFFFAASEHCCQAPA